MSESPDVGLDLEDLELQLLPAWARQSPDANRYAKYEGGEGASGPRERERHERRGKRPDQPGRRQSGAGSPERQGRPRADGARSEEHTSELQSRLHLVCRLLLEKKKN